MAKKEIDLTEELKKLQAAMAEIDAIEAAERACNEYVETRGKERYEWRHEALEAMKLKR